MLPLEGIQMSSECFRYTERVEDILKTLQMHQKRKMQTGLEDVVPVFFADKDWYLLSCV